MRERVRRVAELGSSVETLEDQIRRVVKEELAEIGMEPGNWTYDEHDHYTCTICDSKLETKYDYKLGEHPILHKNVVDCFKAFLRRMRV